MFNIRLVGKKIKLMFNVRVADDHLNGNQLFTWWLSLVMSLVSHFVLSLDEIWN